MLYVWYIDINYAKVKNANMSHFLADLGPLDIQSLSYQTRRTNPLLHNGLNSEKKPYADRVAHQNYDFSVT